MSNQPDNIAIDKSLLISLPDHPNCKYFITLPSFIKFYKNDLALKDKGLSIYSKLFASIYSILVYMGITFHEKNFAGLQKYPLFEDGIVELLKCVNYCVTKWVNINSVDPASRTDTSILILLNNIGSSSIKTAIDNFLKSPILKEYFADKLMNILAVAFWGHCFTTNLPISSVCDMFERNGYSFRNVYLDSLYIYYTDVVNMTRNTSNATIKQLIDLLEFGLSKGSRLNINQVSYIKQLKRPIFNNSIKNPRNRSIIPNLLFNLHAISYQMYPCGNEIKKLCIQLRLDLKNIYNVDVSLKYLIDSLTPQLQIYWDDARTEFDTVDKIIEVIIPLIDEKLDCKSAIADIPNNTIQEIVDIVNDYNTQYPSYVFLGERYYIGGVTVDRNLFDRMVSKLSNVSFHYPLLGVANTSIYSDLLGRCHVKNYREWDDLVYKLENWTGPAYWNGQNYVFEERKAN